MKLVNDYRIMRGRGKASSRSYAAQWALAQATLRLTRHECSWLPVNFMGSISGHLWWDVPFRGGWLVVKAGTFVSRRGVLSLRGLRWPVVYWSPNATPWHHDARRVFGRFVRDGRCVCDDCFPAAAPATPETESEANDAG